MRNESTKMEFSKPKNEIKIISHFGSEEHKKKHWIHSNRGKLVRGV